ncbi:MAG TPA: PilZ domain-containing protein [Smithellaceae bacterium]|nr:PilZ domain-containing protein [Smithellaceae bacterium]
MHQNGQETVVQGKDPSEHVLASIPLCFHHEDLIRNPDPKKAIRKSKLINLWNRLHFMEDMVYVHLHHPDYHEGLLLWAYPEPCHNGVMTCRWPEGSGIYTENAAILNIIFSDGLTLFLIPAQLKDVQKNFFAIQAPDSGYILGQRRARRYRCQGIKTEVVQNGFHAVGPLTGFSALSFDVKVTPEETGSFRWFNADSSSTVNWYADEQMIFSATCRCIRQTSNQTARNIVFAPMVNQMSRFPKKKWRNPRVQVKPFANIAFDHPAINKKIQLDIHDLSVSGFSVEIAPDEDVLTVGMIIPDLTMNYAGALQIKCKAQVLYRRMEKKKKIRYGFVILDMDVVNYNRLSHMVMNVIDPGTHVADEVDVDQLWEFLFDSGFIYPRKYNLVQAYREPMKETYRRLYRDNPEIATQITYQQNGRIYGHASMVRSYRRTWMVHHLAARPLNNKRTGLQVLKQIMHYFNGLYRLPSVGMDYMMFYFRPDNQFPDHFFGGFARHFRNPRACSLDLFAYLNYPVSGVGRQLPAGWLLEPCTGEDWEALSHFYRNTSDGLLLDVLRLGEEKEDGESLSQLYARHGFIRSCQCFSLKQNGRLKAVLIVNRSDPGLSLSDFLNGIKILITDAAGLPWEVLSTAVSQWSDFYKSDKIPLLVYPSHYFEEKGVSFEKYYNLWIIDGHYAREYSEYMMENSKLRIRFLIRFLIKRYLKP